MSNEPITDDTVSESEKLDLEKQRLECEKLRVEIGQANLSWWKRPGYVGSLAPIILALVGFSSAWISGYFDTQRKNLENEINTLEIERDELNEANEDVQRRIDDAYLRLKSASSNAAYTIGHIHALDAEHIKDARAKVEKAYDKMPFDVAEALRQLFQGHKFTKDMAEETEKDLDVLNDTLKGIPASKWAIELQADPGNPSSPNNILAAPDGRYYHIDDQRYYDSEELEELWSRGYSD